MPQPTKQHLQLVGGANSTNSTLYTSSLVKTGDVLKISGTGSNDGVFTVVDVVNTLSSADAAGTTFTDNTCDTSNTSTSVTHDANAQIIAGLSVSGTGVQSGTYISSITDSTRFVMSKAATATNSNQTLTFGDMDVYFVLKGRGITDDSSGGDPEIQVIRPTGDKMIALGDVDNEGNIDVWSNNATTSYSTKDNGWSISAISPTIKGDDAKYIYHIADGVVRVCDVNETNSSIIKWYGYVQRNQFNATTGLVFAEWQEHPNSLSSPKVATSFSYAFGTTSHDNTSAGNYYLNPTTHDFRGVAIQKYAANLPLQMGNNLSASATGFKFEDASNNDKTGRAIVGEVISISSGDASTDGVGDLGEYPKEFMFCKRAYNESAGTATYQRAYGGNLDGTAPFDFDDNVLPIIERGTGWNIGVDDGTADGDWEVGTYEFYETFIYDGNQESLPIQIGNGAATIAAFTHAAAGAKSLRVSIYADLAYSGRITGGRIYTRLQNTDDDLTMLADIDIVKGVRMSLDGDHKSWSYQDGKGYYVVGNATGNSTKPNLDTYTTINGFSPDVKFLGIGGMNEGYKASVVSGRRVFIANVKIKASSGELEKFGDRIMYSEIGKFDTFLEHNFIDVSKGDFGEYTALESFADRLLAFKHNLVHVINISSPNVSGWFLEETIKHFGVNFPFSVAKTKYGIAWVSDDGCYIYDGKEVRNLINRKIAVSDASFSTNEVDWNSWYRGSALVKDVMLGYDPISNSLIMMRSPNDSSTNSNRAFVYDFDSNGWSYNTNIFTDSSYYTNFVTDFNNNLSVGLYDGSSDVEFKKFLPISSSQSSQEFYTRDIDFGTPSLTKKIYKVTVTYKSNGAETTPFSYAVDGKGDFSSNGGGTFTGNFANTSIWDVVTLTPSSTISCQSIQIKFASPSAGVFEINDITIQYRTIRNKVVS
jgi:hypothetical protein